MRAQPVDATPSGIKLISKVVFMTQGKRFGLSAAQKSDMWLIVATWMVSGRMGLILRMRTCFHDDKMESEWSVRSRKNACVFVRETLLYGFVIFILLACIRRMWQLCFATNLVDGCVWSTVRY